MTAGSDAGPVPLTVIGGYLGVGKTTLLNRLLREPGGRRLGVVVNDFGALAVDAELLAGAGDVVSLPNGCICCTLGTDLYRALTAMMDVTPPPDHVVIEASGVADPAVAAAWGTVPRFRPGGVLLLAAADSVRAMARDRFVGGEVVRQLAGADLILISRSDLSGEGEASRAQEWLGERFPTVPRLTVTAGDVPVDVVLGTRPAGVPDPAPGHLLDELYVRQSWSSPDPVPAGALDRLLAARPPSVIRARACSRSPTDEVSRCRSSAARCTSRTGRPRAGRSSS